MMLLAGLVGMIAVGASVLFGMSLAAYEGDDAVPETPANTGHEEYSSSAKGKFDLSGDDDETPAGKLSSDVADPVARRGDSAEQISGSAGNDQLAVDDVLQGNLGNWLNQEHQAQVTDFSTSEDSLMVVFDDLNDPDPDVTLEQDENDKTRQHVTLNGVRIAAVDDAIDLGLEHITLIPQSSVTGLLAG